MEFKQEVFDRFNSIFKKRKGSKVKKSDLLKVQEDLYQELEMQKEVIQHLKKALAEAHDEIESSRKEYYLKGVVRGRYIASIEDLGVLEEFRMLQEMKHTLENGSKRIEI